MKIAVLGSGSWGTAIAHTLATKGHEVCLIARRKELVEEINTQHTNTTYLQDIQLAQSLYAVADVVSDIPKKTPSGGPHSTTDSKVRDARSVLAQADICFLAIPAQSLGENLRKFAPYIQQSCFLICLSKGIEISTSRRMSEVVSHYCPWAAQSYSILSGPSFAIETAQQAPTAVVLACQDSFVGDFLQQEISHNTFRVYTSTDVLGVEIGGAMKNVIAIATGVSDGLRLGDNARAALITRGLAEITRLGTTLGADPITFMGLSGMGDLVLTCTGDLSRNRQVGLQLGKGAAIEDILQNMTNIAEGVPTTKALYNLTKKHTIDAPVAHSMYRVLYEHASPKIEVQKLLSRALRHE